MPPSIAPLLPNPFKLIDDDFASAMKKATLAATAFSAALYAAPYAPTTTSFLTKLFTGFEVTPTRGIKVTPFVALNLLPQPIGVMNPSLFGLPKDIIDPGDVKRAILSPEGRQAYLAKFPAAQARYIEQVLARERVRLITLSDDELDRLSRDLGDAVFATNEVAALERAIQEEQEERRIPRRLARLQLPPPVVVQPAGFDPLLQEAVNIAIATAPPEERAAVVANARLVPGTVIPVGGGSGLGSGPVPTPVRASPLDPFGVPIAMASIQPQKIRPVTGAALANEAAAEGIRRELVHERADP